MCLTTVGGIVTEQGRLYRLNLNGRLSTRALVQKVGVLREIRCSIEALPLPQTTYTPATINIVTVPVAHTVDDSDPQQLRIRPMHTIEHEATLAIEPPGPSSVSEIAIAPEPTEEPMPAYQFADPKRAPRSEADVEYDRAVRNGVYPSPHQSKPKPAQQDVRLWSEIAGISDELSRLARRVGSDAE